MNNSQYTAQDVADWFLSRSSMSPKKLQKLIYYAYAWTITLLNEDVNHLENRLFTDQPIQAWVHGPVVPTIYHKYKVNGYREIDKTEKKVEFTEDITDILEQVWDVYGEFTADQLESITHQESPWRNARGGYGPLDNCEEPLSDKDIYSCYIQRIA